MSATRWIAAVGLLVGAAAWSTAEAVTVPSSPSGGTTTATATRHSDVFAEFSSTMGITGVIDPLTSPAGSSDPGTASPASFSAQSAADTSPDASYGAGISSYTGTLQYNNAGLYSAAYSITLDSASLTTSGRHQMPVLAPTADEPLPPSLAMVGLGLAFVFGADVIRPHAQPQASGLAHAARDLPTSAPE